MAQELGRQLALPQNMGLDLGKQELSKQQGIQTNGLDGARDEMSNNKKSKQWVWMVQ